MTSKKHTPEARRFQLAGTNITVSTRSSKPHHRKAAKKAARQADRRAGIKR